MRPGEVSLIRLPDERTMVKAKYLGRSDRNGEAIDVFEDDNFELLLLSEDEYLATDALRDDV